MYLCRTVTACILEAGLEVLAHAGFCPDVQIDRSVGSQFLGCGLRGGPASGAAQEPAHPDQHEDRSDDGPDDATEVEHVGVSDPEEPGEDEPTHQRADKAKHDRREP